MKAINRNKKYYTVSVDVDLEESKRMRTHDEHILCDITIGLPFKRNSFDIIISKDVIEHIPKLDGIKMVEQMNEIAKKQIIIITPCQGKMHPSPDNIYMAHKSSWSPEELQALGFKVRRFGAPLFRGYEYAYYFRSPILTPIGQLYDFLGSILSFPFYKHIGGSMIAIKRLA